MEMTTPLKKNKILATLPSPEAYNHVKAPLNEDETIEKVQSGDKDAFEMLVNTYEKPLYGFIASRGIDEHTACDITQEAFIKAFRSISSFSSKRSSFKTWLFTIAFNILRDNARHLKIKQREQKKIADAMKYAEFKGPEEEFSSDDAATRLLNKLDKDIREIVRMRFILGFSGTEISSITGLAPGTIRSKICRGFKKLQDLYKNRRGEL